VKLEPRVPMRKGLLDMLPRAERLLVGIEHLAPLECAGFDFLSQFLNLVSEEVICLKLL
jgi:hypothetical protein